jgi:hypothetical protein
MSLTLNTDVTSKNTNVAQTSSSVQFTQTSGSPPLTVILTNLSVAAADAYPLGAATVVTFT